MRLLDRPLTDDDLQYLNRFPALRKLDVGGGGPEPCVTNPDVIRIVTEGVLADLRANLAQARTRRFEAEAKLEAFLSRGETDIDTRSIQEAVLMGSHCAVLTAGLSLASLAQSMVEGPR